MLAAIARACRAPPMLAAVRTAYRVPRAAWPLRGLGTSPTDMVWRELAKTKQVSSFNAPAENGQIVRVSYVAHRVVIGGDAFAAGEEAIDSRSNVTFRVGDAPFPAFDQCVPGMLVGDVRRIRSPHTGAYGVEGKPPKIAPFEEVIFDITLTGCVHNMHIETLETDADDHSVAALGSALSLSAQSLARYARKVLSKLTDNPSKPSSKE
ncbi:hypothetical protein T492DRAFT_985857 [Pavlovales sp. CCMP2436]|nr:hypothetical protein T492DRAFT_985857 [Pavlovales sp. CCMP2436]